MGIIIGIILVCIYIVVPLPIQLILLVANIFIPDSIYAIDEILMAVSTFKKLSNLANIVDFVSENKVLACVIGVVAAILLIVIGKVIL